MPYNSKHDQLFFIHIPKNAGTSVEHAAKMDTMTDATIHYPDGRLSCDPKISLQHFTLKLLEKELPWIKTKTLFAVTRDPYKRLVSAYRFKLKYNFDHVKSMMRDPNNINFEEYVRVSFSRCEAYRNNLLAGGYDHNLYLRQHEFVDGETPVKIFRLEDGVHYIEEYISSFYGWPVKIDTVNTTEKARPYTEFYNNPSFKEFIDEYYHEDFERYGYDRKLS
jgi:hypothetical protein